MWNYNRHIDIISKIVSRSNQTYSKLSIIINPNEKWEIDYRINYRWNRIAQWNSQNMKVSFQITDFDVSFSLRSIWEHKRIQTL